MSLRKRIAIATALVALGALAASQLVQAAPQVTTFGNLRVTIDGGFAPKKLPRTKPAPITLKVKGSMATTDGTHVPAVKTIYLEFDKHGHLNTKGLATCAPNKVQSTLTTQAKAACKDALIGEGRVTAEIALPEQAPFSASGPLLIFNGPPKGGKQVLVFHVYANVPAPTTVVTTALIGKGKGPYGTSATVAVPSITSGQGSLTSFESRLSKHWTYKGKKQSLLLASCPTGSLRARGDFTFVNGDKLSGKILKSCTPSK